MFNLAKGGNNLLSYIFVFMVVVSIICSFFTGSGEVLSQSMMDGASSAVELLFMMSGMMCLWSGVMEVARESKLTEKVSMLFAPLLRLLFKDAHKNEKAFSYICMNISANLLGLGNAATPLGINAMKEMNVGLGNDEVSDDMVTFVVMNTASLQLLPTTVAVLRSSYGCKTPFDIIFCVWITSVVALFVGLFFAKTMCRGKRI